MRIKQLPPDVANQIAAGEVIERPASIVKELLENALDANASSISIEIGFGGLNQIKITDNGVGICADDLPLAVAAHATSKISQLDDLYALSSMGFRGEALASIASVSRMTISSKPVDQQIAMSLRSENGQYQLTPCARTQGTTVDVCDMFFNAPVRKKFLKTERQEFQAIEMVVKRFAMSCPQMAIKLYHNDKLVWQVLAAPDDLSKRARIIKLLGRAFMDQAIEVNFEHAGMQLEGWVSGHAYQRSQNDKLWVYINGRMVKDRLVNHAIKQAYEAILHPGRHPSGLLFLSLPADQVDVNVHPTKHEVRFQQPRLVHDFICMQLQQVLTPDDHVTQLKEVRPVKAYTYEPPSMNPAPMHKASSWQLLYNRYALYNLKQESYLIDLQLLQKKLYQSELERTALPLPHRPLLVPVHADKPDNLCTYQLNERISILEQLGLSIELKGDALHVKTIPNLFPNLLINDFLTAFWANPNDLENAKQLLIQYQLLDVSQQDQQMYYQDYLTSLQDKLEHMPFSKLLSVEMCQEMFND